MVGKYSYTVIESDLDGLNHMNFNRYVLIFSDARLQWLADTWMPLESLLAQNLGTVLIKFDTTYHHELRLGDEVYIETTLKKVGTKSFTFYQVMKRGEEICAECNSVLVIMDLLQRKAIPAPEELVKNLTTY